MTIAATWVRTLANGAEEMIFCSDSRLGGGKRFDHGQKIFRLARSDAAISFAGLTEWAYPMIVAAVNATRIHLPSQTRSLALPKLKTHFVNILNQMQREVHNFAPGENIPAVTFILGGYDWWKKTFQIWRIEFDETLGKFVATDQRQSNLTALGKIQVAGDPEWVNKAYENLGRLPKVRYWRENPPAIQKFNMEPFEIIRDMLRSATPNDSIGGAPQGAKIYQYMNSTDIGIVWPKLHGGRLFLSGRPLLDYERATIRSLINPDTLDFTWLNGNSADAVRQLEKAAEKSRERGITNEGSREDDTLDLQFVLEDAVEELDT